MIGISGVTRRIASVVVLGALAAPFFGTAPAAAGSTGTGSAGVEAICPPAGPGTAQCLALFRTDIAARPASAVTALTPPLGYGPADLQSAYALPSGSAGAGLTVAVVDALDLPTAESDLAVYRSQFGLPPCTTANGCFRKVNQDGGTDHYPPADPSWGAESALDIEMVSAACPNCHILLVEADGPTFDALGAAVNTAVSLGAIAVSNSYSGPEWSGEASYDGDYTHPGVAITASTGDCGYNCSGFYHEGYFDNVGYPAASPDVVAVGGTSLTRTASARGWTESAWGDAYGGAGSGCSVYEPKPAWQQDTGCPKRTEADVSAVADPLTGVAVYDSYGLGGWQVGGGTSAASPIIAATFALAGGPAAGSNPASYLYGHAAGLNDVTGGDSDVTWHNCTVAYLCNGVAGYDGPTGLGTPNGIGAFAASGTPPPPVPSVPATYHAIAPARLLDTRSGNGLPGKLSANSPATFGVTGRGGVPAGATAVTGNVTVTGATKGWAVYLGPDPTASPTSSTINFNAGDVRANGVTVALGTGGTLSATYMSTAGNTTDLVFDVTGYFTPDTSGATYHPLTPARLLDTRSGNGLAGKVSANSPATFQVSGRGGVPAGASAVTGNLTVTGSSAGWAVFLGPDPTPSPGSSTINFGAGDTVANGLTVALGSGGTLSATYMSSAGSTTDLVFDVTGYFTPDSTGAKYVPMTPARLLDTRSGNGLTGTFGANAPRTFTVVGRGGVPSGATGVTGNLTVVDETGPWAVFLGPDPTASPTSSTINFSAGEILANGVTVALGGGGSLSATYMSGSGATTDLVFDVTGYFTP